MAQACEAAGFDTFWLAEAYPWWRKHSMEARSSTAITAIIAQRNEDGSESAGELFRPTPAIPVQIAMEARVLQDVAGRAISAGPGRIEDFHEGNRRRREGQGEPARPW